MTVNWIRGVFVQLKHAIGEVTMCKKLSNFGEDIDNDFANKKALLKTE